MAARGETDTAIAQAGGDGPHVLPLKAAIPGFRHAIASAKQPPIVRVERSLYHRAVG